MIPGRWAVSWLMMATMMRLSRWRQLSTSIGLSGQLAE
jgi:hypothetical protein